MLTFLITVMSMQPVPSISPDYDWACPPERRAETSTRMEALHEADQADRSSHPIEWSVVAPRDRERRAEVAAIFAEGCLVTGMDHLYAASIYNHATVSGHNYQTYLWAQRAVALGVEDAQVFVARGIDRFLLATGYEQLFGANASADAILDEDGGMTGEMGPFCLDPVAEAFTDDQRKAYGFSTLQERLAWVDDMNDGARATPSGFCDKDLATPPHGLFPGIW